MLQRWLVIRETTSDAKLTCNIYNSYTYYIIPYWAFEHKTYKNRMTNSVDV